MISGSSGSSALLTISIIEESTVSFISSNLDKTPACISTDNVLFNLSILNSSKWSNKKASNSCSEWNTFSSPSIFNL